MHQSPTHAAQGGDDEQASHSGTRWHGSASDAARALAARGVEVVKGDLLDPSSLRSAFAGAHGAFVAMMGVTTVIPKYVGPELY